MKEIFLNITGGVNLLASFFGVLAVALFVSSYQIKSRKKLIAVNAVSRVLYVIQYLLLGAFEGALLDTTAFFVSLLCHKRDNKIIKRYFVLALLASNAALVGVGLLSYENVFSLLAILGVVFETLALWLRRERHIRALSLVSAPFWFAYNTYNGAYGSSIGSVIMFVSVLVAILRYDILGKKNEKTQETQETEAQ